MILPGLRTRAGATRPKEGDMTRQYEVVYIFDSALEEPAINERLNRFHALIQQPDGEALKVNHWGKRTLAYPIKKRETGYYVVANFSSRRRRRCPSSSAPSSSTTACSASWSWSTSTTIPRSVTATDRKIEEDDE